MDGIEAITPRPEAQDAEDAVSREALVLRRIAASAGEPLRAASVDGSLARLNLGRAALGEIQPAGAAWRDAETGGLALSGAVLDEAGLEACDLSGANLRRASLKGAMARSARLNGAVIEEADFSAADLSGAGFSKVAGGQARFEEAMLEDAGFEGATLRFATFRRALLDGARFADADLWGADFTGADADYTVFRGARLDEAKLSDVNLTHADFEGASLKKVKLDGSRLSGANLNGVRLDGADLSGADLSGTSLVRLDLLSCTLTHARFAGAWLDGTRMRPEQLGGAVGEERAHEFEAAQESYRALERNFKSIGSHEAASWAYKRGRHMGRRHAGAQAKAALRARDGRGFAQHAYRWAADRFVEWLCDYGESLSRIARTFALGILAFAALYGLAGGLLLERFDNAPTYNPIDLISYSALNMLTANPPEIGIKPVGRVTNLLVGIQGATGIVLMGLFGYVLGNRLRR